MKFGYYLWQVLLLLIACVSSGVKAIGVSSMLEYVDERGKATFIVSNSESSRQYINTAVSELIVVNGEIKKIPYTRDNIEQWVLDVRPARTILEPGFKKNIVMQYQPKKEEREVDRDRVFQITFVPSPYFADGEVPNQVKIAFGFAPLLIVPAKKIHPLEYDMSYQGNKVVVTNKGKNFFSLSLEGCAKDVSQNERQACTTSATVLAGRKLEVILPKNMINAVSLKAKVFSFGSKFKAETTLTPAR